MAVFHSRRLRARSVDAYRKSGWELVCIPCRTMTKPGRAGPPFNTMAPGQKIRTVADARDGDRTRDVQLGKLDVN